MREATSESSIPVPLAADHAAERTAAPSALGVAAAFAAVYLIWGSTYLAIRVAVQTLPPFTMAGVRHVLAGAVMYAWLRTRGEPRPQRVHWKAAAIIGTLLLLGGNGLVVWAEQTVPSGIAALLVATLPLWMVLLNSFWVGGSRPNLAEVAGVLVGFAGVFVLIDPTGLFSGGTSTAPHASAAPVERVDGLGATALIMASLCWAIGSLWSRHVKLPRSPLLATGMQMLAGGAALLIVGLICGEWGRLKPSEFSVRSLVALVYLILFGSFIGFSAYVWLLRVTTPAKVSTYAYVNPVVAVVLGWAVLDERLGASTFLAMGLIIAAVLLITTFGKRGPVPSRKQSVRLIQKVTDPSHAVVVRVGDPE